MMAMAAVLRGQGGLALAVAVAVWFKRRVRTSVWAGDEEAVMMVMDMMVVVVLMMMAGVLATSEK